MNNRKKILVINPNTSREMTETIAKSISNMEIARTTIDVIGNEIGPESIECITDEIITSHGVLSLLTAKNKDYDAFVIACFSDHPAIKMGRELIRKPVVGIMEAAIYSACLVGNRFSIITSSKRWEPLLSDGVKALGIFDKCASVRSSGLSVLDFNNLNDDEIIRVLLAEAKKAIIEDGAEVICLGCAGMAGLEAQIADQLKIPVVDGVHSAIFMAYGLISMGLLTSKLGSYESIPPRPSRNSTFDWQNIYQ